MLTYQEFKIISLFTIMEDYNSSDTDKEKEQENEKFKRI